MFTVELLAYMATFALSKINRKAFVKTAHNIGPSFLEEHQFDFTSKKPPLKKTLRFLLVR